jgi:osmotically-inducible protein OsmY
MRRGIALCVALVSLVFLTDGVGAAQTRKEVRAVPFRVIEDADKIADLRGSKLIGSEVKDAAGKSIGKIEDLIVGRDGKVSHAVLSFGGMLGVGARWYAVPWNSMRLERDDKNNVTVMLDNVKKETLEKAPRYSEERRPVTTSGRTRADGAITAEVKTKLATEKVSTLMKVDVDTRQGVVHLTGTVDDERMRERASEIARRVDGVRDVRNDLKVKGG